MSITFETLKQDLKNNGLRGRLDDKVYRLDVAIFNYIKESNPVFFEEMGNKSA